MHPSHIVTHDESRWDAIQFPGQSMQPFCTLQMGMAEAGWPRPNRAHLCLQQPWSRGQMQAHLALRALFG